MDVQLDPMRGIYWFQEHNNFSLTDADIWFMISFDTKKEISITI